VVSAAVDGGKLMGYFNLPWFAWGSAEMNLGDSKEYNTLVRVTSPYDRLATAVIKLFVYYNVCLTIYSDSAVDCMFLIYAARYKNVPLLALALPSVNQSSKFFHFWQVYEISSKANAINFITI